MIGTLKTKAKLHSMRLLPLGRYAEEAWASGDGWELTYQVLPHVIVVQELDSGLQAHCILAGSKRPRSGSPLVLQPERATEASGLPDTGNPMSSARIR